MLPLVGVLAFALLSLAALTTDLGLAASEQNRLEVAAEAAALGALREAARIEHDLASDDGSRDDLPCALTDAREACIEERAYSRGRSMAMEILRASGDETEGPGYVQIRLTTCGDACWEEILRETPPSGDETEVDLGPGDVQIRLEKCGDACWEAEVDRAIPLLFGQASFLGFRRGSLRELLEAREGGSALVGDGLPVDRELRTRGVPIGGLVRADARPVVRVGPPVPESGLPGQAPFALTLDAWRALPDSEEPTTFTVDERDLLLGSVVVGHLIGGSAGLRAGDALALDGEWDRLSSDALYLAYVPLIVGETVVGFGYAGVESGSDTELVLRRLADRVAPGNASASPRFLVDAADVAAVLRAHEREEPLLLLAAAPAAPR